MIAQVILEVMLVLGDKVTLGAFEQLFGLDVKRALMMPIVLLLNASKHTLATLEYFWLAHNFTTIIATIIIVR